MNLMTTVRRVPKIVRNARRDMKYGRPLGGLVRTRYADLGAHDVGNADYDDLDILFRGVDVAPRDVIVDVGCGKGRSTNWFLERYPANKIYGIELDPQICAGTARRLRRFGNVTVLCGDATAMLPPDGTIFYLYNPFDAAVMSRFIDALLAPRPAAGARADRIVYYNDKFIDLYRDDPHFVVRPVEDPLLRHRSSIVTLVPAADQPEGNWR